MTTRGVVVIGVGNPYRHDDGVGPAVVAALAERHLSGVRLAESDGDTATLLDLWDGADVAFVVDAIRTEVSEPGRVHRLHADRLEAISHAQSSSHGLGLGDAVDLAAVLGRLPERLVIFAVEGSEFSYGVGLSTPVDQATAELVDTIVQELGGPERAGPNGPADAGSKCSTMRSEPYPEETTMTTVESLRSVRLEVHGVVQGVGFRPYVYRLARELGVDGVVRNAGGQVIIEATGTTEALDALTERLPREAPPRAVVRALRSQDRSSHPDRPAPGTGFTVLESEDLTRGVNEVPPDLATCPDCLRELADPADRRYRYPFVNCTNCGPRATIVAELPYDRVRTTMAEFPLCAECAEEYSDPADRRFHAEPIACPACGPRLTWLPEGSYGDAALRRAEDVILAGGTVALKGIGGYQLVCDATSPRAIAKLRGRKRRWTKPFAVMVASTDIAHSVGELGPEEVALLESVARPIVLVPAKPRGELAAGVHPGCTDVGLFLPYSPLHALLLGTLDRPLVVTSGNRSGEPIAIEDADALDQLGALADGFLTHDRAIRSRYDDSVARLLDGRPTLVRRARGYAPLPLPLPRPAASPVLGAGAQLKHTFALAEGRHCVISPHLGDLSNHETNESFRRTLADLAKLTGITPEYVAHDLHPGYLSTQYAAEWSVERRIGVQHHHAHVASCAAEHGITGPFLGVAYDGLGYGDDGTLWGGEVLVADLASYRRVARFGQAPLPGGEAAIRRPARTAMGYLFASETDPDLVAPFLGRFDSREIETIRRLVRRGVNSPLTSSAGRLFDVAASLLNVCDDATYEGEAAVRLEAIAKPTAAELPWRIARGDGLWVYDHRPTLRGLLAGVAEGLPVDELAGRFHAAVAAATVALCAEIGRETGLRQVCLSGGVFQNRLLTERLLAGLRDHGFEAYINHQVPTNDGGISYGQAAIAVARIGVN